MSQNYQEEFEKFARKKMNLTKMSPPCNGITYFYSETQNAFVDFIESKLMAINSSGGAPFFVNGKKYPTTVSTLEKRT